MKTIANVMLVLNEAEFIEAAIRSVWPGVDQLIVIDQGSTDETRNILTEIEDEFDSTAFSRIDTRGQTFLTRGEQFFRNLTIDLCFCDWMMITDGDEIMGDGWEKEVRTFLNACGDIYGAIRCNYWQMIGTSGYHTPDSPLVYESGERPLFFRKHPGLHAGEPMAGTLVHTSITNVAPAHFARLSGVDCFHLGYAKSDMTARYERNIERGDWTQNEAEKLAFMKRAVEDPLQFLPECVPLSIPRERLPTSIREPKFDCEYCQEKRRIISRKPRNL